MQLYRAQKIARQGEITNKEKRRSSPTPSQKSVKNVSQRQKSAPSIRISDYGRYNPKYPYIQLLLWVMSTACKLSEAEFRRLNIL